MLRKLPQLFCGSKLALIGRFSSTAPPIRRLENKVAVVTASTKGIGLATAHRLAQEGAKVVVSSRKETNVKEAIDHLSKEGLEVVGMPCHVGKAADRDRLIKMAVEMYGGIDILVSNAATNPLYGPALEAFSGEAFDKIFDINVKCTLQLVQQVVPYMEARGSGPTRNQRGS